MSTARWKAIIEAGAAETCLTCAGARDTSADERAAPDHYSGPMLEALTPEEQKQVHERTEGTMSDDGRCWCGAVHPAGWRHASGAQCAYRPAHPDTGEQG